MMRTVHCRIQYTAPERMSDEEFRSLLHRAWFEEFARGIATIIVMPLLFSIPLIVAALLGRI